MEWPTCNLTVSSPLVFLLFIQPFLTKFAGLQLHVLIEIVDTIIVKVLGHEESCFVKEHLDSSKYAEEATINMLEFLVANIFVVLLRKFFRQIVGIPIGTNCAFSWPTSFCTRTKRNHTVFALNQTEAVSISVQHHIRIHR